MACNFGSAPYASTDGPFLEVKSDGTDICVSALINCTNTSNQTPFRVEDSYPASTPDIEIAAAIVDGIRAALSSERLEHLGRGIRIMDIVREELTKG